MTPELTTIDISPDDRIFSPRGAGALNIGLSQCLAELVANSLDWALLNSDEADNMREDNQWEEKIEKNYE